MKILIIEDETEIKNSINDFLTQEGYLCECAKNIFEAEDKIISHLYDIILLDIGLPDGNGITLLKIIQENLPDASTIIISAKNSIDDKIEGLNLGADDYITKPFHLAELNARIKTIKRRKNNLSSNDFLCFEAIKINLDTHIVQIQDTEVILTQKEYKLLVFFILNKNKVLTKEAIIEYLWGDYMDTLNSLDFIYTHIKNVRKKIKQHTNKDYIKTVYGIGYRFSNE